MSISLSIFSPILITFLFSKVLSSLLCKSYGIEFISSKKIVPPFADSNNPSLSIAPVKLPLEVPKKMLSIIELGIAAQFCIINGLFLLLLLL